jgi:glycerophosphoryl diester phosphodiesterase
MRIIGHRGARGLAPENTIAAFRKGLEHHVDGIEFDLRVTKDGMVIVHHNPELTDPNGEQHLIANTNFAELKDHKQDLVTFEELLKTIGHPVPLYVEIKPGEPVKPIIKIIKAHLAKGWKPSYFRILSFSQDILREMRRAFPDMDMVVLEKWSGVRASRRARELGTKRIIMKQRWLWWGFIRSVARSGYKLGTDTLDDPKKARRWERWGLHTVVTDYPDRFEKR